MAFLSESEIRLLDERIELMIDPLRREIKRVGVTVLKLEGATGSLTHLSNAMDRKIETLITKTIELDETIVGLKREMDDQDSVLARKIEELKNGSA